MAIAHSKLTARGRISVPAEVRRHLGPGPGSIIEWHEVAGQSTVRRAGAHGMANVHAALFPEGLPGAREQAEIKDGIAAHLRARQARG